MGTTADTGTTTGANTPRRPLWHAPLFVVGVAALVGVLYARPFFPEGYPDNRLNRALANARSILGKADGNAEFALKVAGRALDQAERFPDLKGEAAFLCGWASQKLAEKADAATAAELWRKSKVALEQAREAGVPEEDKPRLAFRLGKARMKAGEIRPALDDLEEAAASPENRVEAYILLSDGCLRLQPPDLKRALKANRELRENLEITDEQATAAKLTGGSILLMLGKPDEARASLEKITDAAPPEILQQARLLRARSYQNEKPPRWEEAALVYKEALADARAPVPDAPLARFYLGVCYKYLEQPKAAIDAWVECVRTSKGPEGLAAGLALADAYLVVPDHDKAAAALARAAAVAPPAAKWANPHLPANEYADLFTRCLEALKLAERHDLILDLADAYAKAVPPKQALAVKAAASAALGAQKRAEHRAKPSDALLKQARDLSAAAGAAREVMADLEGLDPAERGEELFQAAMLYLAAEDPARGATVLFRLVKLEGVPPARLGEARFRLAEHYRETGQKPAAVEAYRKCMEYDTPFSYRARYQLAMAALEGGEIDEAEAMLSQNVRRLSFDSEPETRAQSTFALANLLYQRKQYTLVVRRLEVAIGQFKESPLFKDSPELTRARFQLADSYRQMAAIESQNLHAGGPISDKARDHFEKQYKLWQRHAADEFSSLDRHLQDPAGQDHLTREQRTQVPFIAAKCIFNLGQHEDALKLYERLIKQHGHSAEGLDALGGAVSCHAQMRKADLIRQRMLQIEMALPHVPPEVQNPWKKWLEDARKQLPPLEPKEKEKEPATPPPGYPPTAAPGTTGASARPG